MAATASILAICTAVVVWIYFRDWQRPQPLAPERALALTDAKRMVSGVGGIRRCPQCRIDVLDADGVRRWRVRVTGRVATRCFWIDLDYFGERPDGGYDGVHRARCVYASGATPPRRVFAR